MRKYVAVAVSALALAGAAWAAQDRHGNQFPAMWRSSYTETAEANAVISSGTIILHSVTVSSPTGGSIRIYDNNLLTASMSTVTVLTTDTWGTAWYDVILSSALFYTKTGAARVNILWEYLRKANAGQ